MTEHYYYYSIDIARIFIAFLIILPVLSAFAGIVWKLANLSSTVKKNTDDLNNLGKKLRASEERHVNILSNLMEKIEKLMIALAEVTTSMDHIKGDLSELKDGVKELEKQRVTK